MGANQSYEGRTNHDGGILEVNVPSNINNNNNHKVRLGQQLARANKHRKMAESGGGKKHRAKPGPPHKPRIVETTHDSITLAWQPPRCNPALNHSSSSPSSSILAYVVEMTKYIAGKSKGSQGSGSEGSGILKQKPGQWVVLTKTCQATSYSARDLEPDTTYAFRVRAENLYGVGKPSVPSDTATTRMYETTTRDSFLFTPTETPQICLSPAPLSEKPYVHGLPSPTSSTSSHSPLPQRLENIGGHRLGRRHSFNVHLDGGAVNKIANHSDLVVPNTDNPPKPSFKMPQSQSCHDSLSPESLSSASSFSSKSSTSLLPSGFSPKHRFSERRRAGNGEAVSGDRTHRLFERAANPSHPSGSLTSLCRKNSYTGSRGAPSPFGQNSRKISLPILLPGTGTASLSKLRESRTSLRSSVSDVNSGKGAPEVMLVTVDRGHGKSKRNSHGSLGSTDNICANKDRYSRTSSSNGSGGSEVNSSQVSLEESVLSASEVSRGLMDNSASGINGTYKEGFVGGSRCGSYNSLSVRSSRSNVTLSNSKDGSKDSLCDELTSSNHSSVGGGNPDDVDSVSTLQNVHTNKLQSLENNEEKNGHITNTISEKQQLGSFLNPNEFDNCDDIYKLKEQLRNFAMTEENLRFHDLGQSMNCHRNRLNGSEKFATENGSYYASLENPWEKEDSSGSGLSERILAAPFCDDIKMALYARDLPENSALKFGSANSAACNRVAHHPQSATRCGDTGDFRTLRSVLQSSNMFVKAQRFSPDVVGVIVGDESDTCRMLTRAPLTTIADADEDDDPVRITTI